MNGHFFYFVCMISNFITPYFFQRGFMEDGVLGMGAEYQDTCGEDNNCMAMLSFQVLTLMLMKPVPKFLKDVIVP